MYSNKFNKFFSILIQGLGTTDNKKYYVSLIIKPRHYDWFYQTYQQINKK
jgi:hypothetical protein